MRSCGCKPQTANRKQGIEGFTLIEMIMVIVITGIIGSMVAVFLKAPIQQYMDVSRRAELSDIADTALYRLAGDISTAVPNSIRPSGSNLTYIEFLPTKDGGRYRANPPGAGGCGVAGDELAFAPALADTCFEVIGVSAVVAASDYVVVGSTQSDGAPAYDTTAASGVLRQITSVGVSGVVQNITMAGAASLPAFAKLPSQRFDVVDGTQKAVTYACVGTLGALDTNQNGQAKLMRYWGYGYNPTQTLPATTPSAILADKVSGCVIDYAVANQRMGLLGVRLTLTSGGESVSLYQEIHVSNAP